MFKTKLKLDNKKENHNEINLSTGNSLPIELLNILTEMNTSLGYLKSTIEIVSKQIDKLSSVDNDIREKQKLLEIDVRQLQLNQSRIMKKLKM